MFINILHRTSRIFWKYFPKVVSIRPSLLLLGTTVIVLGITLLLALIMPSFQSFRNKWFPEVSFLFLDESLKVIAGAFIGGVVVLLVSNSWQQKSVGLEMLKELNSPELMSVRNALSTQMKISRSQNWELENLKGWFPKHFTNSDKKELLPVEMVDDDVFIRKHALATMIYFVVRLSNYARAGMLNVGTTRHLFSAFFVHYRIVILEFADAMEEYYNKIHINYLNIDHPEVRKKVWVRRVDDLRYFFDFLELGSNLKSDGKYQYQYFISLNLGYQKPEHAIYATDIDLEEYKKNKRPGPNDSELTATTST